MRQSPESLCAFRTRSAFVHSFGAEAAPPSFFFPGRPLKRRRLPDEDFSLASGALAVSFPLLLLRAPPFFPLFPRRDLFPRPLP